MFILAITQKISIEAPIDPEINIKSRDTLEYYITFPNGYDKSKKYGLVFCITGYGDSAVSDYQMNKLRPYIADKYNIIVVGVRYHNDLRITGEISGDIDRICNWYGVNKSYFKNLNDGQQVTNDLYDLLISKNLFSLDPRASVKCNAYHNYSSFGFMPAIDHLIVLFDILNKYNIDKSNIISFGSSYGGYISLLMAKYAPNTFSLIIDNSGFCVSDLHEIFGGIVGGAGGSFPKYVDGKRYEIPFTTNTLWSLDETSEYYFSDSHKKIRSLILEEHRTPSKTVYFSYHSQKDSLIPIEQKDKMYDVIKKFNVIYYKRVNEQDMDGKMFKSLSHGMSASLKEMFDFSVAEFRKMNVDKESDTDFDRNVTYGFPCLDKLYNFTYTDKGFKVEIDTIKIME